MEASDWIVLTCPQCTNSVRAARHLQALQVTCPSCHHSFAVAASAAEIAEASQIRLPETRDLDLSPFKLRGATKEAWEVKPRDLQQNPRQIDFRETFRKTTDQTKLEESDNPPRRSRKVFGGKSDDLLSWEEQLVVNASPAQRLKQFLRHVPWPLWIVILGAIGGVAYKVNQMRKDQYASNYEAPPPQDPIVFSAEEKFGLSNRATILAEISPVLVKFLASKTPEEMKPIIREPERVIPLMDKFYSEQTPFVPPTYRRLPTEEETRVERRFVGVKMEDAAFQNFVVTLERTPHGYLVDWESFVRHGDMSIAQLRTTRPTTPVTVRCILRLHTYYNYDFRDETLYQSYQLKLKDEEILYGYVRKLSPAHEKIMSSQLGEETLYAVIKVKFPEQARSDNQVEITEFLQSGWVFREMP